jgi:phage terminase small subunit
MSKLAGPAPLNPRQLIFVEEYLVDLNGKEAAIRAGYTPASAKVRAAKPLRQAGVRQAVAAAMAARAERSRAFIEGGITAERVIAEYARVAFSDWRHFAAWGPGGVRFAATRALTPDDRAAVAEIVEASGGVRRVKLFDKQAALNSLSRIFAHADSARFRRADAPADLPAAAVRAAAAPCPLSDRQRRFADEFLKDLDASAAARRAGYAPRSAPFLATKLRRYPGIAARIAAGIAAKQRAIRIEADRVLEEYARIAFADIGRIADWSNKRLRLKPRRRVAIEDSAAVASPGPVSKSSTRGATLQLRLHDKVYALDMLARHLGLLDPRMPGRALKRKWPVQRTSAALRQRLGRA